MLGAFYRMAKEQKSREKPQKRGKKETEKRKKQAVEEEERGQKQEKKRLKALFSLRLYGVKHGPRFLVVLESAP
jgi:hypothetical protein